MRPASNEQEKGQCKWPLTQARSHALTNRDRPRPLNTPDVEEESAAQPAQDASVEQAQGQCPTPCFLRGHAHALLPSRSCLRPAPFAVTPTPRSRL